jgi:hypothetical protein
MKRHGILVIPTTLQQINNRQVFTYFLHECSCLHEEVICMFPSNDSNIPPHVVLNVIVVNFLKLHSYLMVAINCRDVYQLPIEVLLNQYSKPTGDFSIRPTQLYNFVCIKGTRLVVQGNCTKLCLMEIGVNNNKES